MVTSHVQNTTFWYLGAPFWLRLGALGLHFGTLWHHFGGLGTPMDLQWDTLGSRLGFLSILGGFWAPLGIHFGVILVTFS